MLKQPYLQPHWPALRPVRSRGLFVCHVVVEGSAAENNEVKVFSAERLQNVTKMTKQ
jgi:hypothetical protein